MIPRVLGCALGLAFFARQSAPPSIIDMRWNSILFYVAVLVFVGGAVAIMMSIENGSDILALGGTLAMGIALLMFLLAAWFGRRTIDWDRIQAEQRLWESGPLGRKWLRVRRRMYRRWKL